MPHDPTEQRPVTNFTACKRCGLPLNEEGDCVACRNARAARWYAENTTRHNAESMVRQKVKRWFPEGLEALQTALEDVQGGTCACCGHPSRTRMGIDWSLDQTADDGCPLVRGVVCRSCKIAINRYVHPSRFVLMPEVTERVEQYLCRAWIDPRQVHRGSGGKVDGARFRTEDLVAWLDQVSG